MTHDLTFKELYKLAKVIKKIESRIKPLCEKVKDGFSNAYLHKCNGNILTAKLIFGIKGSKVETKYFKINRHTMKIKE